MNGGDGSPEIAPPRLHTRFAPCRGWGANIVHFGSRRHGGGRGKLRAGRINWRLFAWMAPPSGVGAVAGDYLAGVLPESALLLAIAAVLLYAGSTWCDGSGQPRRRRLFGIDASIYEPLSCRFRDRAPR